MRAADVQYLVVHCSATAPDLDIGRDEIDGWHRGRGWREIGYHFVIRRDGTLEKGRDLDEVGAHCRGHNRVSLGICMVGGVNALGEPEDNFTEAQFATLERHLGWLETNGYSHAVILGHRDLSPDVDGDGVVEKHEWLKDCPCFDVREWWLDRMVPVGDPAAGGEEA